jgi:hypothetical protein
MKVSELERLYFGDVIITCFDNSFSDGRPIKCYYENVVTWVRIEAQDGPLDENDPHDFDVMLMDSNGLVSNIRHLKDLDDCECSHNAFKRGAWKE